MKKSVKWLLILLAAAGVGYYFSENRDEEPEFATQKLSRGNITEKVTARALLIRFRRLMSARRFPAP